MQNSLYMLFEHKCVLEVCAHIHPIKIKIHPVIFFKSPFSNQAVLRFLSEWRSSARTAPTIVDWQDRLTLDPPWESWELSTIVSIPVQGKTRMSPKWLRCFVVRCNNEHSSRHLLLKSEPLKTQWITFVFEGNATLIYLNVSMFAQIIRDPTSSTEEVSEYKGFLWIFAICLS